MHLPATGLASGEVDSVAEALEHANNGFARFREQSVVVAGDEERDAQARLLGSGRNFNTDSISQCCIQSDRMMGTFRKSARGATETLWDRIRL
jgi:tRNA U54 and U55 pseudouridine synthase Pus10